MKTSVSIPDRIYRSAEQAAKREKVTRSRLYSNALEAYLKARVPKRKRVTEAPDAA